MELQSADQKLFKTTPEIENTSKIPCEKESTEAELQNDMSYKHSSQNRCRKFNDSS